MRLNIFRKNSIKLSSILTITTLLCLTGCNNVSIPANGTVDSAEITSEFTTEKNTTSSLPEGVAFIMKDGTEITINSLLEPAVNYNKYAMTANKELFPKVYPLPVIDYMVMNSPYETLNDYSDYVLSIFLKVYGEGFAMNNEFVSCRILTETEINDFIKFYTDELCFEMIPDYAFLVESEYTVTYTDEAGDSQSDTETDYYIAYSYEGKIYMDYLFLDTMDL